MAPTPRFALSPGERRDKKPLSSLISPRSPESPRPPGFVLLDDDNDSERETTMNAMQSRHEQFLQAARQAAREWLMV